MPDELKILDRPVCCHLRSKGMFINAGMPPGEELADDGNVWCLLTQEEFGPDGKLVSREHCLPGRACHQRIV